MSNFYNLTYSGLVFAISSALTDPRRTLILRILAHVGCDRFTSEQLLNLTEVNQQDVDNLMTEGFFIGVDDFDAHENQTIKKPEEFISKLETLSVNGKVILADTYGLILATSGYSKSDSEYIAAIATNLVKISQQARARIKNQTEKNLWTTGLSWGRFRALCMSIDIGDKQYILVVGGLPDLEKKEFFDIVSFLVRRYGNG